MRWLLIAVLILAVLPCGANGEDVVKVVTSGTLRPGAMNDYDLQLLRDALERTRSEYGPYKLQPFTEEVSVVRAFQLASDGRLINLVSAGVGQPALERDMIPVPFPIDKGLLGYRVALINRNNQARLSRIHNIEQLRQLTVGQGSDWGDVRIYRYNHIPVETTPDYKSMVLMLLHGRFDLFPRGLWEIAPELAVYGKRYPDLAVEQHLLLHYPFCEAFYVSRSDPHLAERLMAGLNHMEADGSFNTLFNSHFGKLLASLNLRQRVIIELNNPFLPVWIPIHRRELWFDPSRH